MNTSYIQIAAVIGIAVFSGLGAVIGYLLKDIRSSVKDQHKDQAAAIETVREDLAAFKAQVPKEYVLREDFVRTVAGIEHKINAVAIDIKELLKLVTERRSQDESK